MDLSYSQSRSRPVASLLLICLGVLIVGVGWVIPSRFKSVPLDVLRQAGTEGESLVDLARAALREENVGKAKLYLGAAQALALPETEAVADRLELVLVGREQLARWGAWDPFLDAAIGEVPLERYSSQPGIVGVLLAKPCRQGMRSLLENSRNPLVADIIATGQLSTYKRLFPVASASGAPLDATLMTVGLAAQGERFTEPVRSELRNLIADAMASGDAGALEDFYLDMLSLGRLLDWGQFKDLVTNIESIDTFTRARYAFHRNGEELPIMYAAMVMANEPESVMDYLGEYGDQGFAAIKLALRYGLGSTRLLLREGLPIEDIDDPGKVEGAGSQILAELAQFSLENPFWSLAIKYSIFFVGAYVTFWGSGLLARFYSEMTSPLLAFVQRLFGAGVSVIVLVILSEPYLASGETFEGYSFRFVVPVLAQQDGETVIIETEPTTTSMETATLLSISFFFVLQALVFTICLLKIRQIERQRIDSDVKLKLMDNEDNLFDTGLYVGIAGTCISLVMQVLGLIEANLIAAYSSNLFGILCVAIVKIRLVRPYKNRLILASEREMLVQGKRATVG